MKAAKTHDIQLVLVDHDRSPNRRNSPFQRSNMNPICDNCGHDWSNDQLKPIRDLHQRVAPGEAMPAGECPECGAVCHVRKPFQQVVINISGGLVQGVFSDRVAELDVIIVDWDQDGVTQEDMIQDERLTTVGGQIVRAFSPTIHPLCEMDEELQEAVRHIDEVTDQLPCECAQCGNRIETLDDETSTPSGSMHSQCAVEYEAENPEDW